MVDKTFPDLLISPNNKDPLLAALCLNTHEAFVLGNIDREYSIVDKNNKKYIDIYAAYTTYYPALPTYKRGALLERLFITRFKQHPDLVTKVTQQNHSFFLIKI